MSRVNKESAFGIIRQLLSDDDLRESVITEAVGHISEAPEPIQRRVRIGLGQQVPGFRDALKAPRHLVVAALKPLVGKDEDPTHDILTIWARVQSAFLDELVRFLLARRIGTDLQRHAHIGNIGDVYVLVDAFLADGLGRNRDHVALGIGWLNWHDPNSITPDSQPSRPEEGLTARRPQVEGSSYGPLGARQPVRSRRLSAWLDDLASLPSSASEWDDINVFLDQVRKISEGHAARRAAQLGEMEGDLAQLRHECGSVLEILAPSRMQRWNLSQLQPDSYEELRAAFAELRKNLQDFGSAQAKPSGSFTQYMDILRTLGEQVTTLCDRIESLLSDERPRAEGPLAGVGGDAVRQADERLGANKEPVTAETQTAPGVGRAENADIAKAAEIARLSDVEKREVKDSRTSESRRSPSEAVVETVEAPSMAGSADAHRPRWGRLVDLTDREIAETLNGARPNLNATRAVLTEQQLRWLMLGQNLRGYVAARFLEEHPAAIVGGDTPPHVPAWLCWLALLVSDQSASQVEFQIGDFIRNCVSLGSEPMRHQRFFVAWICAGLLGDGASRCIQVVQHTPGDVFEDAWADASPFLEFCAEHVVGPARRGRRVQLVEHESRESLRRRASEEIEEARRITDRAVNYRNRFVVRYWIQLAGPGGPVQALLTQAADRTPPPSLPEPQGLAAGVPGWPQIQAAYRNNILQRLATLLDHIRIALAFRNQAESQVATVESTIRPDQIREALKESDSYLRRLRDERCPSVGGYMATIGRLRALRVEEVKR